MGLSLDCRPNALAGPFGGALDGPFVQMSSFCCVLPIWKHLLPTFAAFFPKWHRMGVFLGRKPQNVILAIRKREEGLKMQPSGQTTEPRRRRFLEGRSRALEVSLPARSMSPPLGRARSGARSKCVYRHDAHCTAREGCGRALEVNRSARSVSLPFGRERGGARSKSAYRYEACRRRLGEGAACMLEARLRTLRNRKMRGRAG